MKTFTENFLIEVCLEYETVLKLKDWKNHENSNFYLIKYWHKHELKTEPKVQKLNTIWAYIEEFMVFVV